MAVALRNASPLKPEIRLAQALSEFEAILQDGEKAEFRLSRSRRPPSINNVMEVTASIDRNSSRRKSRRCFGPRLTNVLESVQQFSTIIDLIVGGSQSLIAGGIWGTLKMTLQITSSFASYFDDISALFMRIGRACPRFQEYGALYPKSARLQKALCEYFCTIVELCKRAVLFIRKPLIAQITASITAPFRTEFSKVEADLNDLALTIRDEASLASKQELSLESKEHAGFRTFFSIKTNQEIQAARALRAQKRKFRFLDSCSVYNHQTAWKRARKAGTSSWLFATDAYREWVQEPTSGVLWCAGILGSGKTVLSASLVQEITVTHAEAVVAYFFCSYDDAGSLKARTIVGSLARQLLRAIKPEDFDSDDTNFTVQLDEDELVTRVLQMLPVQQKCFIVIDGLDECTVVELNGLFACLERMVQSKHNFHVFCSSRPDLDQQFRTRLQAKYLVTLPDMIPEVSQYIESELLVRLEAGSLSLGDPSIILAIQDALLKGCKGMFLWVVFQIDALCAEPTDEAILDALDSLPRDLPATFDRLLRKVHQKKNESPDLHPSIFALIAAAQRPLNLEELREALSVEPGNRTWDPRKLVNDMRKTLGDCGSLLVIDEEDSAVRFAHHSVKQYLISASQDPLVGRYHVDVAEADLRLGEICVTYLNLGIFDREVIRASDNRRPLRPGDLTTKVIQDTMHKSSANKLALKLLKSRQEPDFNLDVYLKAMASETQAFRPENREVHAFLGYAQDFWLLHSRDFDHAKQVSYGLLLRLASGNVKVVTLPWGSDSWKDINNKFLDLIIKLEHKPLLCKAFEVLYEQVDWGGGQQNGLVFHTLSLKILNLEGYGWARDLRVRGVRRQTLSAVLKLQPEMVMSLLLEKAEEINAKDHEGRTSLHLCVQTGDIEILQFLLGRPEVEVNAKDDSGRTALVLCAGSDNVKKYSDGVEMFKMILAHQGIDVNAKDDKGRTALLAAIKKGNSSIVRALLSQDGDVNCTPAGARRAYTPIHEAAALRGDISMMRLPRDRKDVDVNSRDLHGRSALIVAAVQGDLETVKLLFQRSDLDPNIKENHERTALHEAVISENWAMIDFLLARIEVDVNAQDQYGSTPLHHAVEISGEVPFVVEMLLKRKDIKLDVRNRFGHTPLDLRLPYGKRHPQSDRILDLLQAHETQHPAPEQSAHPEWI